MNSIKVKFVFILLKKKSMHIYPLSSLFHPLFTVQGSWEQVGPGAAPSTDQEDLWSGSRLGAGGLWGILSDYLGFNWSQKLSGDKGYLRIASIHSSPRHCFLDYEKDPYSRGDPCNTICCREDLNSQNPSPGGCYDTKVICYWLLNLISTST